MALHRYCFLLFYAVAATLVLGLVESNVETSTSTPTLCKSIVIRDSKDFELIRNCSVIVGHVRIVNFQVTPSTSIPASKIEEITDYLLVHRVHGLLSLQHIFPRLKLIRGQDLLFDRYSLVVHENRDLETLGFVALQRVQKGAIRIEDNPMLCFVDTVNWVYLLGNSTRQRFSFKNKPSHQCPLCDETLADADDNESIKKHCWSLDAFQRNTIFGSSSNCPAECGTSGCDAKGMCCSRKCLTGCSDQSCELCGTLKQNGRCVDTCGFTFFQFNKRDCVKEKDCVRNGLIPHAGICLENCPAHYEKKNVGGSTPPRCILQCDGNYVVHSAKDLSGLRDCTTIQGSLTIELVDIKAKIAEELELALVNIKEITGYLKIKNSPQLVSLQFLKNLHTIRGNELIDYKYALYVVNNNHLEHIWDKNHNVAILKGRIYFHLNPRLCFEKIQHLKPSLKAVQSLTPVDASPNSNGERVICGESVRVLNATVEDYNATAVRIKVNPMSADDKEVLVGYVHYYKEAPQQNVTQYDGRHGCGHDNWLMDISPNRNVRHVIADLKPYTQYAFFVKTLTMTDYHTQLDAYSKIKYFRTLPSKPGPPEKLYYHTLSRSEIMIHWWPPRSPNGEIATYLIFSEKIVDNSSSDATTNYLSERTDRPAEEFCRCQLKEPFHSGPPPEDENFYNKEQLTYDEALPNFIYVAREPKQNDSDTSEEQIELETPGRKNGTTTTTTTTTVQSDNPSLNDIENSSEGQKAENDYEEESTTVDKAYQRYRQELERKSLALQDTGPEDFPIIKYPSCTQDNVSVQYQIENRCRSIEHFEGFHLPSHIHQHTLTGLDEDSSYQISVRACQKNGECSSEITVMVKTISKKLEDFIRGAQTFANDIEE